MAGRRRTVNLRWLYVLAPLALLAGVLRCAHPVVKRPTAPPVQGGPVVSYDYTISAPVKPSRELEATVADAVATLTRMTGKPFTEATAPSARGIVLARTDSPGVGAPDVERLSKEGPEAFLIRSTDGTELHIIARNDVGLAHGLYYYLGQLGCRWFFPSERWTIVPARADIGIHVDRVVSPFFRTRGFFGTGGFGPPIPLDPAVAMRTRWDAWRRRNGFGGDLALGGHAGGAFVQAHAAELKAHPEYMALIGGKRVPWPASARLCVSNPDLVKLYVEDRLAALRQAVRSDPNSPQSGAVSVEPADGPGHCECDRCRVIGNGTEADQVFYLANQVAKAIAKEFPGRFASLYAYGQHAAPPTIPVEKNVYVTVIPEAFQRTGMTSDALVAAWHRRVEHLGLYTYWSIPDWSGELPTFDWLTTPSQRLPHWRAEGIEGVGFETSYGSGPMGPGLYVASRLLWDPAQDAQAITKEFLDLAFGASAPTMRRLLTRWATHFTPSTYELGLSYRDLADARRATSEDPAVSRRVRDYEAYLHYIRLWVEYQAAAPHSDERRVRARQLVVWLYRIYDTGMVASHRMRELILERYERDDALRADFDPRNFAAAGWAEAKRPIADEELAGLMADGARVYPPSAVEARSYSSKLVGPAGPRVAALSEEPSPLLPLAGATDLELDVLPGRGFEVEITVNKNPQVAGDAVSLIAPDGRVVHEELIPPDGALHVISLTDVPPGRYRCHIEDQKAGFRLKVPPHVPMSLRQFMSTDLSPRVYFWVPRGVRRFAMFAPSDSPVTILDGDGKRVRAAERLLIEVDVPSGQDGRAWSFRGYKSWSPVRMINLPEAFGLSPETLLVPEDAAR